MGLYVRYDAVRIRLIGKVRFTEDEADENKMQIVLANRLIRQAESEVEMDLSPRYAAPFQTADGQAFTALPESPTRTLIGAMCELLACIRILETDFGSGSVVDAAKYTKELQKRYTAMVAKQLQRKPDSQQWLYPPLPQLMLGAHNFCADDGFAGMPQVTSSGDGDYPKAQINNPAQTYWNADVTELDKP